MRRVLIAGCGYVGSAAAKLFAQADWEVSGWTRTQGSSKRAIADATSIRAVDITDVDTVRRNCFEADLVVHCASAGSDSYRRVYRDGAANLVDCFPNARIIFTSSTSVYGQRDGSWVTEESITEPLSENAKILLEAENLVLAHKGIILRVAGIYGPGRSFFLRSVIERTAPSGDRIVNQVHRDDVASAIFFLAQRDDITGPQIFNVIDNVPTSRSEILSWLATRLNLPAPSLSGAIESKRGNSNKRVSNAKLRALGWAPRFPSYIEGFDFSVIPALAVSGA